MTASLRVKNDKYYVVLTHTTDGKKNQTWVSTGLSVTGNEGKARQIMLDMLGEKPEQAAPPDMLFSDAVRRWLEDVRHRVDEVTYQGYEVQARAHILPYFDDLQIRLCDVDGETLQTYINVKAKFGRSDGHGGLSAVSLRQHKNVLNQTLKLAQRDGLIQTNPADLVVMPHSLEVSEDPHALLREIYRILIPGGRIILTGFNLMSLWGLRFKMQRFGAKTFLPGRQFMSVFQIRDWLHLLSFHVDRGAFGCYGLTFSSPQSKEDSWIEKAGDRWWPQCGAIFAISATKEVAGCKLVGRAVNKKFFFLGRRPAPKSE